MKKLLSLADFEQEKITDEYGLINSVLIWPQFNLCYIRDSLLTPSDYYDYNTGLIQFTAKLLIPLLNRVDD